MTRHSRMSVASIDRAAAPPGSDPLGNSTGQPIGRLQRLEALRGLAAVYVLLHHVTPGSVMIAGVQLGWLFRFGQEAVILFFLLSGFVIHYAHRRACDRTFRTYFLKRGLRIYVPLLIVFPLSWLLASLAAGRALPGDWTTLLGNVLMLQDWAFAKPNVIVSAYMDNGPLWSLSYEWWFYLLYWPVAHHFGASPDTGVRRRRDAAILLISVGAAALYCVWPTFLPRILMYFGLWWSGVMLADAWMDGRIKRLSAFAMPLMAQFLATAVLALNAWQWRAEGQPLLFGIHPVLEVRHFAFGFIACLASFVWLRMRWLGFGLLIMPFARCAPISYSLYITHYFMLAHAGYLAWIGQPMVEFVIYFAIMLLVCWATELRLYPAVRRRVMRKYTSAIGPIAAPA